MPQRDLTIAYLAPEIPALSATFVYNEILTLINQGVCIKTVSVHRPAAMAGGSQLDRLAQETCYLYRQPVLKVIGAHFNRLIKNPFRFVNALCIVFSDIFKVGLFTPLALGLIYRFFMSAYLAVFLKKHHCDHLHVHFAHIPTDLAMYASLLSGIPFSFTSHANDLFERGWLLKEKVKRSSFAVTISEFNRKFLQSKGASAEKVYVIHCGVHSADFTFRSRVKTGKTFHIGALGRMVEKKGFDDLIAGCNILKQKGVSFCLDLAGDGPLKQRLTEQVDLLRLDDMVNFRGALAHESVPSWLENLDLFVLPCKVDQKNDMDGIPVVLMEAMLTGVPVVSTNISGIPELVIDGHTGGLSEAGQPKDLARVMMRILSDTSFTEHICHKAANKVRSEFDLEDNVNQLLTLFKERCP